MTHGRVKQEKDFSRTELLQKSENGLSSQGTDFSKPKFCRFSRQVPQGSIIGQEERSAQQGAFHRDVDVVTVHDKALRAPPCPPASLASTSQGRLGAGNTPVEKHAVQVDQLVAVAHPFQGCPAGISPILKEEEIGCGSGNRLSPSYG
jgi:hypothetical protein